MYIQLPTSDCTGFVSTSYLSYLRSKKGANFRWFPVYWKHQRFADIKVRLFNAGLNEELYSVSKARYRISSRILLLLQLFKNYCQEQYDITLKVNILLSLASMSFIK